VPVTAYPAAPAGEPHGAVDQRRLLSAGQLSGRAERRIMVTWT
jgi:hypothetical protein